MSDDEIDPNAWMVTFADLVMLLLTFFVLLLTMASMDAKKLKSISTHFREATGVLGFSDSVKVPDLSAFISQYNNIDKLLVIDKDHFIPKIKFIAPFKEMLEGMKNEIEVLDDERGVIVSFNEKLLFDSGKVKIKKEIFPILDMVADAIYECRNDILIMGNTDNIPIKGNLYKSNWELSAYRGLSVLKYFLKEKDLEPSRFYVGGYGPSRPLYPNNTAKNRSINRRVEIIFKHLGEG